MKDIQTLNEFISAKKIYKGAIGIKDTFSSNIKKYRTWRLDILYNDIIKKAKKAEDNKYKYNASRPLNKKIIEKCQYGLKLIQKILRTENEDTDLLYDMEDFFNNEKENADDRLLTALSNAR